jgi:hypothetical protein
VRQRAQHRHQARRREQAVALEIDRAGDAAQDWPSVARCCTSWSNEWQ